MLVPPVMGASLARLLLLGAIWGASHALTRFSVPALGPVWLVELRIGLAALMLSAFAWFTSQPLHIAGQRSQLVVLGTCNTALPFFLLTYAAQHIDAAVLAILNATAPVFGALIGAAWLKQRPTLAIGAGLLLGSAGVGALVGDQLSQARLPNAWPVAAALCASFLYGFSSNYARRHADRIDPLHAAHGSLWVAFALMLPATPTTLPAGPIHAGGLAAAAVLGIVCTGVAYLLYYRLIRDEGPTYALTVAYLIPVFGVAWGAVLLGEPVTRALLVGAALVLTGTALATGTVGRLRHLPGAGRT